MNEIDIFVISSVHPPHSLQLLTYEGSLNLNAGRLIKILVLILATLALAQTPSTSPPDAQEVVAYLQHSIEWHRQMVLAEQLATDPTDLLLVNDGRQTANQALRLSSAFARAHALLLGPHHAPPPAAPEVP